MREYIFNKYHGLCDDCGSLGEEVHHRIFLTQDNINDPDITLGEVNLVLLCRDCHMNIHNPNRKQTRQGLEFDNEGNLIQI